LIVLFTNEYLFPITSRIQARIINYTKFVVKVVLFFQAKISSNSVNSFSWHEHSIREIIVCLLNALNKI